MAVAGAINVLLSASVSQFSKQMASGASSVASFAGAIGGAAAKVTALAGAATALVSGGGFAFLLKKCFENIDTMAKLSDRVGITTENLTGLAHAANLAGVDSEGLTTALEQMLNRIEDAATKGGESAAALEKIGLNARELMALGPDAAFKAIADALAKTQDPFLRANVAMDLFGKAGQKLLPLMMSGAEGIKAAQQEAAKLGITFSRVDAAKVEEANDALTKVAAAITGVANTIAIQLAPYITAASDAFVNMATSGGGAGNIVVNAVEFIAVAVAKATDYVELFKAGWYFLQAGVLAVAAGVIKAIDLIGGALVALVNLMPGVELEWTDTFSIMADSMAEDIIAATDKAGAAIERFSTGENAAAASKVFTDLRAKADASAKAVADNAEKMRQTATEAAKVDAALHGFFDDMESEGEELAKKMEKVGETLEKFFDEVDEDAAKQAADALKTLQDSAKEVFESTRTPMEKYEATIGKLSELLNKGLINWDTYGRAVRQAREELEGAADVAEARFADFAGADELASLAAQEASRIALAQPSQSAAAGAMAAAAAPAAQAVANAVTDPNQNPMLDEIKEMKRDLKALRQKVEVGS